VGKRRELHLEGLEADLQQAPTDIKKQQEHKIKGKTYSTPVYATLRLQDNQTGDSKTERVRIASIPVVTQRYSHIVDGAEYQVDSQWQLKPGAYTRRGVQGQLHTAFNAPDGRDFHVELDPASKQLSMRRRKSNIPLYPLLKELGVPDAQMEKVWGKEMLEANRKARGVAGALEAFYKADTKSSPTSRAVAADHFKKMMADTQLRPEVLKTTLGTASSNVTGDVLFRSTKRLLDVQAGGEEDDRDSLEFKRLRSVGDYAYDKLTHWRTKRAIENRAKRKLDRSSNIRDMVKFDSFNEPVKQVFRTSMARMATQINPVEILSSAYQTTPLGPGGIQSIQRVTEEAKAVNPTHLGYLDPLRTPEGEKTGITLRLPLGVRKKDGDPVVALYNTRTKRMENVPPSTFVHANVALADQVSWKGGKPVPRSKSVKMAGEGNKLRVGKMEEVDYVQRHPSQMFNTTTNLIPFINSCSGNRATYAGQHLEQAISLDKRETPLVQVGTGAQREGIRTFEEILGRSSGHVAPVDGKVVSVGKGAVVVQDAKGKKHSVQLYDNFPLNDAKGVIDSTPLVKVGDTVKKRQAIADTNFTRGGKLALGTNLEVAYLPYRGYNFEDGVVISSSAAKKLSSVHMQKLPIKLEDQVVTSPAAFKVQHPEAFSKDQHGKLDEQGVVKVGQRVKPGDPLVLAMRPYMMKDRMDLGAIRKSMAGQHTDISLRWQSDYPGEVVGVHRKGKEMQVHVRTIEPMREGDKIAGRHGNKGIVTKVLEDAEMPHTKDGRPLEVLLNPSGVPGRINPSQLLETAAGKVAKRTGKPYVVENFANGEDNLHRVKADLQKHGLSDTEEVIDPITKTSLGQVLTGPQHMLKLTHQIDKKTAVRSGMPLKGDNEPESYDKNLLPIGGGKTGGQRMSPLGIYSLLAHGAKANIRELQTIKSEGDDPRPFGWPGQHREVWQAIQSGTPLPTPRPTFSFAKFTAMLKAAGVNVEKKGHNIQLLPLTNAQVLAMSSGAIPKPAELTYTNLDKNGEPKPKKGGLFDPQITGGHGGKRWNHIKLAEPVPNPVFEGAIQKLTRIKRDDYNDVVGGDKALDAKGKVVSLETPGALTGGAAIKRLLQGIDVDEELGKEEAALKGMRVPKGFAHGGATQKMDDSVKRIRYLRALKEAGAKPADAYVLDNLPVIPPQMRPASVLQDGSIKWDDINGLYQRFAQVNDGLGKSTTKTLMDTDTAKRAARKDLYDGVKALMGVGTVGENDKFKGILRQIHGTSPKEGFFQKTMMNRRQDLSMRSVIVPEPALGIDEVGLPKEKALSLYRPFVARKLVEVGAARNPLDAREMLQSKDALKDPSVMRAVELVADERPVLLKRDPVLHKHGVQAFKPRLVGGKAIQIHPLVTGGFSADFDGDTMSAYVPVGVEAVEEAKRMLPSNNLYAESSGKVTYQPNLDSALGLFKMSRVEGDGKRIFKTPAAALQAAQQGKLGMTELATVGGVKTTPGRLLLASNLPKGMQEEAIKGLPVLDKKGIGGLYTRLAKEHKGDFGETAGKLMRMGYEAANGVVSIPNPAHKGEDAIKAGERPDKSKLFVPMGAHSLSLKDLEPDRAVRDKHLRTAQKKIDLINARKGLSDTERTKQTAMALAKASEEMDKEHKAAMRSGTNNLATMLEAGTKPSWNQYKQLRLAPVIMEDSKGEPVAVPVDRSYSEGLDLGGYWTASTGARRGSVRKVQEVSEPGYLSKKLVQTSINLVVSGDDCKTDRGISMGVGDANVYDRTLARPFSSKGLSVPAGTVLTPDIVGKMRKADKKGQVVVRSALKCKHGQGLCQICAGMGADGDRYPVGTNVGVLAAQSLGERSVQLPMKAFHMGGIWTPQRSVADQFERVNQLTALPDKVPNEARLAMVSGKVEKIETDRTGAKIWIGGKPHHVGKDPKGNPLYAPLPGEHWRPPKVGDKVAAGTQLSDPARTVVNPRTLYKATNNFEAVQNHLADELHAIYSEEGVRRQHVETVVKGMTNVTKVRDPGDAPYVLKGEMHPSSVIREQNADLVRRGKRPVKHSPILKGINVVPLSIQQDWLAKLQHEKLRGTIMDAAATGAVSHIHGLHPIPGIAYGAELGMTRATAKKTPGMTHLLDVPEHSY